MLVRSDYQEYKNIDWKVWKEQFTIVLEPIKIHSVLSGFSRAKVELYRVFK